MRTLSSRLSALPRALLAHPWLLVTALLVLATALRLPFTVREMYHNDEYLSLMRSLAIYNGDFFMAKVASQKPPLYYLILATLFTVAGYSRSIALVPCFLFSLATIVLVYLIAQRIYRQTLLSLAAAFFVTVSVFHILFSPTILLDPLMILFGLLSWLAILDHRYLLAGVCFGLSCATKQQGVLFAPFLGCCFLHELAEGGPLYRRWRELLRISIGPLVTGGLLLAWGLAPRENKLNFIYGQIQSEQLAVGRNNSLLVNPFTEGWAVLARRFSDWWRYFDVVLGYQWQSIATLCGLSLLVLIPLIRKRRDEAWFWDLLLLTWIACFLVFHSLVRFRFIDRYMLPLVPFVALAFARVLVAASQWLLDRSGSWRRSTTAAITIGWCLIATSFLFSYRNIEERGVIPHFRSLGVLYGYYPELKQAADLIRPLLSDNTEVYCTRHICFALEILLLPFETVRDIAWPQRFLRSHQSRSYLERSRYFLCPDEETYKIAPLQEKLAPRFVLIPMGPKYNDLRIFKIEPVKPAE